MRVDEHTITLDESPVFYRSAGVQSERVQSETQPHAEGSARRGEARPLYVHGLPTSSRDWEPFLEQTGGLAPDLIGFGRSGKGSHLDYTPHGLAGFLAALTTALGIDRFQLVAHGWGVAAAILLAGSEPARVDRLVLISPPPALPRSHRAPLERVWRTPVLGELAMGSTTKTLLARGLCRGSATRRAAWPPNRLAEVWKQFDQGTQRAILRLHRGWGERESTELEAALERLAMPALVLWGDTDPWCRPELAEAYAARLPQAKLECIPCAGHWPWLDVPDTVERVSSWLAA